MIALMKRAALVAALFLAACTSSHQAATESTPTPEASASTSASSGASVSGGTPAPERLGKALVYVPFPGNVSQTATATLTLPSAPSNQNWYCNFVMIVGYLQGANTASFVELGEMRRPGFYAGEKTFLSWQGPKDTERHYKEIGPLGDGPHTFTLVDDGGNFTGRVDGGAPFGVPGHIVLPRAYAQVGPEIATGSDTLTGYVSGLTTSSGGSHRTFELAKTCRTNDNGLSLAVDAGKLYARGTFDATKSVGGFLGDCSWF